jgi:crotonobetainyl-CoA:carnitine CoA-transferase CaiB-like acyl-CoA transferase
MFLAGGVCAGLVHVLRTGKGIVVDGSLLASATWTLGPDLAYSSLTAETLPMPTPDMMSPLIRQYRTSDGYWISLMMIDEARYWTPLCAALELPEFADQGINADSRKAVWPQLAQRLEHVVGALNRKTLISRLQAHNCIFSFYSTPADVLADVAVVENGYLMSHPHHTELRLAAAPVQFDDELPAVCSASPSLGEHSRVILRELGYPSADIERMSDDQVIR